MNRRNAVIMAILVLVGTATAFCVGRVAAVRRRGGPARVARIEQEFALQARSQLEAVRAERTALSAMLADANSTDRQIRTQMDRVIVQHAALVRAVGGHVVQLRAVLPPEQHLSFMKSCADSLHGQVRRRYRWRGGAADGAAWQDRGGTRGGNGWRGGVPGAGPGRQFRGGRGAGSELAERLQLAEEQAAWAERHDPNFGEDCTRLKIRLRDAHAGLASGFEDGHISDEEFLARVEDLIAAHNDLEERVAGHILLLRPQLSPDQRQRLASSCRGGQATPDGGPSSRNPASRYKAVLGFFSEPALWDSI